MTKLILKYLVDFWILDKSGIVLFHFQSQDEVDKNLFGAITIALNSYADLLSETGGLDSFQFITKKFTFLKKKTLIFVGLSDIKSENRYVKQELNSISEKFFQHYSDDFLKNWKGNIRNFIDFDKIIGTSH